MAKRETAPKPEETTDRVVEETKPIEVKTEEVAKEERPVTEVVKEEVQPDRPQPVAPVKPLPTRPNVPVNETPVTPRPGIDVSVAEEVDAAFQLIIDKLPKKAEFDYRTNRMLNDVLTSVGACRRKAQTFFKYVS